MNYLELFYGASVGALFLPGCALAFGIMAYCSNILYDIMCYSWNKMVYFIEKYNAYRYSKKFPNTGIQHTRNILSLVK